MESTVPDPWMSRSELIQGRSSPSNNRQDDISYW